MIGAQLDHGLRLVAILISNACLCMCKFLIITCTCIIFNNYIFIDSLYILVINELVN